MTDPHSATPRLTKDNLTSLQSHILAEEQEYPGASGEFSWILSAITLAGKTIANKVRRARIEDVLNPPKEGTLVRIFIFVQPVAPFEIAGHVARVDENGFAIHYDNFDEDIRKLVDDVSAIVGRSDPE